MSFVSRFTLPLSYLVEKTRAMEVVVALSIAILILDLSLSNNSEIVDLSSVWSVALYVGIGVVCVLCLYVMLEFTRSITKDIRKRTKLLHRLHSATWFTALLLTLLVVLSILEISILSQYHTMLLPMIELISYGITCVIVGMLAARFFIWYRLKRDLAILLYGLSFVTIITTLVFIILFDSSLYLTRSETRNPDSTIVFEFFYPNEALGVIQYVWTLSNIVTYLLIWTATAILLEYHSKRIGRFKFWGLLLLPLISFVSVFFITEPLNVEDSGLEEWYLVLLMLVGYTLPGLASGILAGIPFLVIGRSFHGQSNVGRYFMIAGVGLILFYITTSATVYHAPYPPFGLMNIIFTSIASFLIIVGLYSSAISVAHDIRLRKNIKQSISHQLNLAKNIGTAEMEYEIQSKVADVTKRNIDDLVDNSGIEPSLNMDNARIYIDEALKEVKKSRD
jgi:hypothetical protein